MNLGIYINLIFECKIDISFYNENRGNSGFEKQFECEIPAEIKNLISELMNLDLLTLKYYYADMSMDDMSTQDFVINHGGISHNTGIGILLKTPQPQNQSEKLFFDLLELFKKWREEIYQQCLKEL